MTNGKFGQGGVRGTELSVCVVNCCSSVSVAHVLSAPVVHVDYLLCSIVYILCRLSTFKPQAS